MLLELGHTTIPYSILILLRHIHLMLLNIQEAIMPFT